MTTEPLEPEHFDYHGHHHPYHLVDPSYWPLLGSLSAGVMAGGAVWWMHNGQTWSQSWGIIIGLLGVLSIMFVWWRGVIREAVYGGFHNPVVQIGLRFGMALFIASEVMFFSAFFWAYFSAALYPTAAMGGIWPPKGIHPFDPFELPFLNTLILLTSGTTVTWAHHALLENDRKGLIYGLGLTVILGLCFTGCQAWEYSHAAFGFTQGMYPSTFFMATGFHGAHVIIGTTFLLVCWFRARAGHFRPDHHFGFEAAAWYWHFVDVVWLFLFICIYWWGSAGVAVGE